jgi:hypothetical protein
LHRLEFVLQAFGVREERNGRAKMAKELMALASASHCGYIPDPDHPEYDGDVPVSLFDKMHAYMEPCAPG